MLSEENCFDFAKLWRKLTLALIAALALWCTNCTTTKQSTTSKIDSTAVRTVYKVQQVRDTCYIRDSVFVRIRADTVYIDRWKTMFRERIKTDTVRTSDTVRVFVDKNIVKEVEVNHVTGFQNFLIWCGVLLIAIVAIYIVYKILKPKLF